LGAPKLADRVIAHIKSVMSSPKAGCPGQRQTQLQLIQDKSNSKGEKREAINPEPGTLEP
jgi:hypothetical protein